MPAACPPGSAGAFGNAWISAQLPMAEWIQAASSLYRNKPELFGCREDRILEDWILHPVKFLPNKVSREKKIKLQKGTKSPGVGSWDSNLKTRSGWVPVYRDDRAALVNS